MRINPTISLMKGPLCAAAMALLAGAPAQAAWTPVDCADRAGEVQSLHNSIFKGRDVAEMRRKYRAEVMAAKPRTPLYAPHPYPKTRQEVVQDFKYAYFNRLFEGLSVEQLPPRERPIYSALQQDRLRFDLLRVENWEMSRCLGESPVPFYHLLRLIDSTTGREVARSKLYDTGHLAIYKHVSEEAQSALPSLADLSGMLRSRLGVNMPVEAPQYVMSSGLPHCWDDLPCIAFRSKGKLYVLDAGKLLYEIDPAIPRISVSAKRQQQMALPLVRLGNHEIDAPTISLGFEYAKARLIAGRQRPD